MTCKQILETCDDTELPNSHQWRFGKPYARGAVENVLFLIILKLYIMIHKINPT